MHFNKIATASAFATAVAALETHGGIDFEVLWDENSAPETKEIKTFYETTGAKQAATRLYKRIADQGFETDCMTEENKGTDPASLYALKECIAAEDENAFFDILAEDIEEADAFWEKVIAESTKPRNEWVAARGYVRGYFDGNLTAPQFAAWMASEQADTGYLPGNPEHYYKHTVNLDPLTQRSHIFEGWGGVLSDKFGSMLTNFTVPEFMPREFGTEEYPSEWAIDPSFGILQRAGPKLLANGKTWGVLHIGARDVEASENSNGKTGIEVYGAVWYPPWDQSSEENQKEFIEKFLMDESYQVMSEVVNFSLQALEDCASGACVVPEM